MVEFDIEAIWMKFKNELMKVMDTLIQSKLFRRNGKKHTMVLLGFEERDTEIKQTT